MAFTRFLEPWAVATNFEVVLGLRPAGFFTNTTALSVFGVVCLCYFYAQYVARREPVGPALHAGVAVRDPDDDFAGRIRRPPR